MCGRTEGADRKTREEGRERTSGCPKSVCECAYACLCVCMCVCVYVRRVFDLALGEGLVKVQQTAWKQS